MFGVQAVVVASLVAALLSGAASGWYWYGVGRDGERAVWLEAERSRSDAAAELARMAGAAQVRRSVAAEQQTVAAQARVREVKRQVVYVARPDCEWSADERMRLQAVHDAYFAADAAAGGVPGGLRGSASAQR